MKLKIGHVFQAAEVVTIIINQRRAIPTKGAYRLARLYSKLKPEYDLILARRNAMIEAYDHHEMVDVPAGPTEFSADGTMAMKRVPGEQFSVPMDKMPEFTKAWAEVANEEIEIEVQPIPLDQLTPANDAPSAIGADEFIVLDDLVVMTD